MFLAIQDEATDGELGRRCVKTVGFTRTVEMSSMKEDEAVN